jgi:hypothetical protein
MAKRFSMSVILLKIKNQTGEVILPASCMGNSSGDENWQPSPRHREFVERL